MRPLASLAAATVTINKYILAAAAQDDWPMYMHDLQRSSVSNDTTISASNAGQLVTDWTFKTGGTIGSAATVVAGTAYVGSWDGYEYALDATTGVLKWKTYLGQPTAPMSDYEPPSVARFLYFAAGCAARGCTSRSKIQILARRRRRRGVK